MIPKLARPRTGVAHDREALYALLDEARRRPAVWLHGPPGAGKTTAVSRYTIRRDLETTWYLVDEGDTDPAAFFYYLRLSAGSADPTHDLPLLTPECFADLRGFARRFFRTYFERAQRATDGAVLVLDNLHALEAGNVLLDLLSDAIDEIGSRVNLIMLSREAPAPAFARAIVNGQLAIVRPHDLELSRDEVEAIALLHDPQHRFDVTQLHQRAHAWAAGVTLLIEAGRASASWEPAAETSTPQIVFDYLASEVFERAPPALRTLWLRTALMRRFTPAMAAALADMACTDAAAMLEGLWRARYFIDRRDDADSTAYQYHDLFRDFLQRRLRESIDAAQWRELGLASAARMRAAGEYSSAVQLLHEAQARDAAIELTLEKAPELAAQGRFQTLAQWIESVQPIAPDSPAAGWLLYWRGVCLMQRGAFDDARACLADAHRRFDRYRDGDSDSESGFAGVCMSAATIADTYSIEWKEFRALDPWIERLDLLLTRDRRPIPADLELRLNMSLLEALFHRQPLDPRAERCGERIAELSRLATDANARAMASLCLANQLSFSKSLARAHEALAQAQDLFRSTGMTPLQQVRMLIQTFLNRCMASEFEPALAAAEQATTIAQDNGLAFTVPYLQMLSLFGLLPTGRLDEAVQRLDRAAAAMDARRLNDATLHHFMRASIGMLSADAATTPIADSSMAFKLSRQLGSAAPEISSACIHAAVLGRAGRHAEAIQVAREANERLGESKVGYLKATTLLFEAHALWQDNQKERSLEVLADGLRAGRSGGFFINMVWLPAMMARLCATALEHDIEVAYVRELIRKGALECPDAGLSAWPYPIRIATFGTPGLTVDGVAVAPLGKAQRKPMELLLALAAHGGQPVDANTLIDALWPELDGDAARNAFNLALHRLRKLLRHDNALVSRNGRLELDTRKVWLDTRAMDLLCERIDAQGDPSQPLQALLQVYAGPFLADADAAWAGTARERYRGRFARRMARCGAHAAASHQAGKAVEWLRSAIDADAVSEELHHALIEALLAGGWHVDALDAYQRWRDLSLSVHGVEPSARTRALRDSIAGASGP